MGKQGRQAWQANSQPPWHQQRGQQQGPDGSGWSYWPGSWRTKQKEGTDQHTTRFPNYSQTHVAGGLDVDPNNTSSTIALEDFNMSAYMRDLQKALSSCRKAENRVRKLSETRATREQQWAQFQKDIRQSFLQNKKQFQKDISGLEKEMQHAVATSQAAVAQVQALASGHQAPALQPAPMDMDAQDDEDSWLSFIGPTTEDSAMPDQCLAQALQEAHRLAQNAQALQARHAAPPAARRGLSTSPKGSVGVQTLGSAAGRPSGHHSAPAADQEHRLRLTLQEARDADPVTPARSTPGPPRTPVPQRPVVQSGLTAPPPAFGTRVTPFPPPSAAGTPQVMPHLGSLATPPMASADPYLFVGSPHALPAFGASPPQGPPKPPKQRAIKDAAKPVGPVHFRSPSHQTQAQLDCKRAPSCVPRSGSTAPMQLLSRPPPPQAYPRPVHRMGYCPLQHRVAPRCSLRCRLGPPPGLHRVGTRHQPMPPPCLSNRGRRSSSSRTTTTMGRHSRTISWTDTGPQS